MGDVAVHDGPEPLDGIEMRAVLQALFLYENKRMYVIRHLNDLN